jgi:hypothetical protein
MRTPWLVLSMFLIAGWTSGCASIVEGQTQVVTFDTPGCPAARCEAANDKGRFVVNSTPGTVSLSRSYADLVVTCTREGSEPVTVSVKSVTKPMAFGNILFGGVIGAGVDIASGAAYDYPQQVIVPLRCSATAAAAGTTPPTRLGLVLVAVDAPRTGLKVLAVDPNSIAELAGLKSGDILVRADGEFVTTVEQLAARVNARRPQGFIEIQLLRDSQDVSLNIRLSAPGAL